MLSPVRFYNSRREYLFYYVCFCVFKKLIGNLYKITKEHLNYKDFDEKLVIYNIISLPSFGSLQYRTETFYNLYNVDYYLVSFSQEDIDKGTLKVFVCVFNVSELPEIRV